MIQEKLSKGWPLEEIMARLEQLPIRELTAHFKPFVLKLLKQEETWLMQQEDRIVDVVNEAIDLSKEKSIRKHDLALMLSVPFLNAGCFERFRKHIPRESDLILDTILVDGMITSREITEKFGIESTIRTGSTTWGRNVELDGKPEFGLFLTPGEYQQPLRYRREWIVFFWPIYLRELAIPLMFPASPPYVLGLPELDKNSDTQTFLGEALIQEELPGLLIHLQQKSLKVSKKGRPSIASVRSIGKKLAIKEFFPDTNIKSLAFVRSRSLMGLLSQFPDLPAVIDHTHLRSIFDQDFSRRFFPPIHLLTYLKGIDKLGISWLNNETTHCKEVISRLPANRWVEYESLELTIKVQNLSRVNNFIEGIYDLYHEIPDPSISPTYAQQLTLHPFFLDRLLIRPTFQATIFVLAAWGLLDIVFHADDEYDLPYTIDSPLNRIIAIRLNALGAYVLGQTNQYESTVKAPFTLELAHDSLSILLTDGDQDRAALAIKSFAKPLGQQRFYTNPNLFLGDCRTPADLQQKISLFRSIFSEDTPPNWMTFFDEMSQKVNPIMEAPEYIAFNLNPENVALLQLIARDPELKSLSLKVEGFMILLLHKDLNRFKKRLQFFGYLLE